jgi:hypothetical protein
MHSEIDANGIPHSRAQEEGEAVNVTLLSDGGIVLRILWDFAFFDAHGLIEHFDFFARHDVLVLVGDHADRCAARALFGLVHELFQFLLAIFQTLPLREELFAGKPLIFTGIGEDRERIHGLRTCRQESAEDKRNNADGPAFRNILHPAHNRN